MEHAGERAGERAVERIGERTTERSMARSGETALEHLGERSSKQSLERLFGVTSKRMSLRICRGVMIALPVIGAFFAFYLFKSDYERYIEEKKYLPTLSKPTRGSFLPLALFSAAGIADFTDAFLHFGIAYGLLLRFSHHRMVVMERMSVGCAIISTLFAVFGEILSLRIRRLEQIKAATSL